MKGIGYISECAEEYTKALGKVTTLPELQRLVKHWKPVASDAYRVVMGMQAVSFVEFMTGLALERKGKWAGEVHTEKYGAILLPEIMMRVSIVAEQFKVPWGTAFIRLREENFVKLKDGVYIWAETKQKTEVPSGHSK